MAQGGGFFKGEKKKPKKGKEKAISGNFTQGQSSSTFSMPEVISKKKNSSW